MSRLFFLFSFVLFSNFVFSQNIKQIIVGRTYQRTFYALIFRHQAAYTFKNDRVEYQVKGFFVNDRYTIRGRYYKDRFVGTDPQTGAKYVLHIKIITPEIIEINKQGVDPRYQSILSDKPVEGWHRYFLKK